MSLLVCLKISFLRECLPANIAWETSVLVMRSIMCQHVALLRKRLPTMTTSIRLLFSVDRSDMSF